MKEQMDLAADREKSCALRVMGVLYISHTQQPISQKQSSAEGEGSLKEGTPGKIWYMSHPVHI
jgi:hypothetical protein